MLTCSTSGKELVRRLLDFSGQLASKAATFGEPRHWVEILGSYIIYGRQLWYFSTDDNTLQDDPGSSNLHCRTWLLGLGSRNQGVIFSNRWPVPGCLAIYKTTNVGQSKHSSSMGGQNRRPCLN